ncbi:MAG: glycosyltransferase [Candidatus Omnitrophota bacterium]
MKIIFITRESKEMPAVRVRSYGFAKFLEKAGYETIIFSYADNLMAGSGKKEDKLSIFDKIKYNFKTLKYLSSQKAILVLQRCNYHSFAPLLLALLNRNKLIFDLDDWEAREDIHYYFNKIPNSKAIILLSLIARKSKLCIGASDFLCEFLLNYNKNILKIPTGVDVENFKPDKKDNNLQHIVLSWIGTIYRKDNLENLKFLIDCFQELFAEFNNIRLEIAGEGIYADKLIALIKNINNQDIIFKNWISPAKMPDYLKNVDIGVMPLTQNSKFNKAKSPTRLFEYMAMEKAVVASTVGEAQKIIKNGENGFLASTKSEFVACLKKLIENEQLRLTIGRFARKTVIADYNLNKIPEKLLEYIGKI